MRAIGTTAIVAVTAPATAERAARIMRDELVAIDAACSRFRADSEVSALHRADGAPVKVSALLFDAVEVACDVARRTEGAVDPTVGVAIEELGYDRDFEELGSDADDIAAPAAPPRPAPGWWLIELDRRHRTVRVPPGVHVDLGASAKALVTDRIAERIAGAMATGVLVSIGGDVAVAGPPPDGGWSVGIASDSSAPVDAVDQVVSLRSGGIASSSTTVRTWHHRGRRVHHIVDPATGDSASTHWRLASCSADSCVDANAASTAAVVWGAWAVPNLVALGHPARLVRHDGQVVTVNGWPADAPSRPHGQEAS
jgi:thiamine biosynthesis lipoprotein